MYKRKDSYYEKAKAAGYRSRAAYKLQELARRYRLIRAGDHVLDLGAWPGGWMQVAGELTGKTGLVVGVDLAPIDPFRESWITVMQGDARDEPVRFELLRLCGGRVDVLLSDMAPKLTGVRATDQARMEDLAETTLAIADRLLKRNGRLLMKVFMGSDTRPLLNRMRNLFREARITHAEATRTGSAEQYVVGLGFLRVNASDDAPQVLRQN